MNLQHASRVVILLGMLTGCLAAPNPSFQLAESPAVAQAPTDFLVIKNERVGPITKDSTEASLRKAFGTEHVKAEQLYVGDGQELPGLAIYPDDPERRIEVIWEEGSTSKIAFIQIQGDRSQWKTPEGVTLGTTLLELEKLNGRPFDLFGLAWDFGGTVTDWKGGALDGLMLRVADNSEREYSEEQANAIFGDQQISSSLPFLREVNPKVFKISISFSRPQDQPES